MASRWCRSNAAEQFRRVNGHLHLPALRITLDDHAAWTVTTACHDEEEAAWIPTGSPPKYHGPRGNPQKDHHTAVSL